MLIIKEKKYRCYIKRDFKILSLWLYGKNLPQLFAIFPYSQLPMDKNKYKQDLQFCMSIDKRICVFYDLRDKRKHIKYLLLH